MKYVEYLRWVLRSLHRQLNGLHKIGNLIFKILCKMLDKWNGRGYNAIEPLKLLRQKTQRERKA